MSLLGHLPLEDNELVLYKHRNKRFYFSVLPSRGAVDGRATPKAFLGKRNIRLEF